MRDIVIIGGGASGLTAAVFAKKTNKNAQITILEKHDRVLKKLNATGNGRCNILNDQDVFNKYHGDVPFAEAVLDNYSEKFIKEFFVSIGVPIVNETEGRCYPQSNNAQSVTDSLRFTAEELGIETLTGFEAVKIVPLNKGFSVWSKTGEQITCKKLIAAVGSPAGKNMGSDSYGLLKDLGHNIVPIKPVLTAFTSKDPILPSLKGQRIKGEISFYQDNKKIACEKGEVLFADYGISGIAAMQLSRLYTEKHRCEIGINIAEYTKEQLKNRADSIPLRRAEDFLTGIVTKTVAHGVFKKAGISTNGKKAKDLSDTEILSLSNTLNDMRFTVNGIKGFEQAQVAAGGFDTKEFDIKTLQSKKIKGLYAIGEALNVDGDCGGYNLRWAWVTGITAGVSAGSEL